MSRIVRIFLAAVVVLTWSACASYLVFDQFLIYENVWEWLDWVMLLQFANWALKMPLIIAIVGAVALVLIWAPCRLRSEREIRNGMLMPMTLTVITVGVSVALWMGFQRSEHFIHIVAGTGTHLVVDVEKRELIWSGRISYFMPNILFDQASTHPDGEWTLVLKDVPGGSIDASNALVGLAAGYGIHTARVEGACYSMCPNIWISFPKLEIVAGSVLGWHGLYDAETGEPMRASIDNALLPHLIERGIPGDLAKSWVNLPMTQFHEMSTDQIQTMNLGVTVVQMSP